MDGDPRARSPLTDLAHQRVAAFDHGVLERLRRQFEVNVIGPVAVCRAFLRLLRQAGGRIINIGGAVPTRLRDRAGLANLGLPARQPPVPPHCGRRRPFRLAVLPAGRSGHPCAAAVPTGKRR